MSIDLVERLRDDKWRWTPDANIPTAIMLEAADEIEWLRKGLHQIDAVAVRKKKGAAGIMQLIARETLIGREGREC